MKFKYNPSAPGMCPSPNSTMQCDGFYISHNDHDLDIYGAVTTALVIGQGERFYMLNGDHRQAYVDRVPAGLDACLAYFRENVAQMNFRSDVLPEPVSAASEEQAAPSFRP